MFLCDNGTYISGFTIAGIKAKGDRGDAGSIDPDDTYGLPPQQGWVAAFRPDCVLRKSPTSKTVLSSLTHRLITVHIILMVTLVVVMGLILIT